MNPLPHELLRTPLHALGVRSFIDLLLLLLAFAVIAAVVDAALRALKSKAVVYPPVEEYE